MQSVFANQADTEQEAGIVTDSQGRACDFGPSHDECRLQFLERTTMSPYQAGYTEDANDFSLGVFHQGKLTDFDGGHSSTFGNGYEDGQRASCLKAHPEEDPKTENGCELSMDAGNP